jgi:polysaccharide export outer membrane protein
MYSQPIMQTQEEGTQMPAPDSFEQGPQVLTVWQILRTRLLLIAGLALLGMLMGLVISFLLPKMYTSTATVEVSKQSPPSAAINNAVGASADFLSLDEMNADELTLQQELESASVSLRVIEMAGLSAEEPYKKVAQIPVHSPEDAHEKEEEMLSLYQSHLKIELVKDTKLLSVTFTDGSAERAAQVANLVIDTYIRSYAEARNETFKRTSGELSTQLTDLRQQVLDSEKKVNEYKERNKIVGTEDLGSSTRPDANLNSDAVVINRFVELNHELTSAQVELVAKEALAATVMNQGADTVLDALQQQEQTNGLAGEASFAGSEYNALTALRQQRSQLSLQVVNRNQYLGTASPQMKQLQSELAVADEQIRAELARIQQHVKGELQLARATEAGLRRLVETSQNAVTALNVHTNQLHLLQQEAQSKRALYQDLFTKLQQENAYEGMNVPTITLIDPARAPITKSSPKTVRNAVTGLVLGTLAGVLFAFVQSPGSIFMLLVVLALSRPSQGQGSIGLSANIEQLQGSTGRQAPQPAQFVQGIPLGITNSLLYPGFLVRLDVFGVPEMSQDLRVDKDGNISSPLLGPVHVEGLTQTQAASILADKYTAAHLLQKDSQITLTLLQYSTIGVVVLGEVQSPGLVQMTPPATLENALAMAGGETIAAGNVIQLQHRNQNITDIPFPRGQGLQASLNTPVNDGDSIYVRKAGVIYVLGSVARPGGYVMVDQGGMNILEAVSLAQGTTIVASVGTVYIIRPGENGSYQTIPVPYKKITQGKVNPVALLARDILYVPNSLTKTILVNGSSLIGAAATTTVYAVRGP